MSMVTGRLELYPDLLQQQPDTIVIINYFTTTRSLSRRAVEEGSLGIADTYMLLNNIMCSSHLLLQDDGRKRCSIG